ncbi:MAG: NUDIX hydrolase [Chloroflexota bacterium]|nr:NUDIX hydrolase [Dehalococcoidia bacterium]MDW8253569.1 NUDIX hydrolase [Chloroflexota bacterium]
MSRERLVEATTVHQGKLLSVRVETVALPNGARVGREIVVHPGAVVMAPVDEAGRLVLVRQYRRAADRELLEFPAGTLQPGEVPEAAVARELAEEIGRAAGRVERLGAFYAAPGYSTELLHCFLCQDLRAVDAAPEADEAIEVVPVPLHDLLARVRRGEIEDAKTLAALMLALPRLQGNSE